MSELEHDKIQRSLHTIDGLSNSEQKDKEQFAARQVVSESRPLLFMKVDQGGK